MIYSYYCCTDYCCRLLYQSIMQLYNIVSFVMLQLLFMYVRISITNCQLISGACSGFVQSALKRACNPEHTEQYMYRGHYVTPCSIQVQDFYSQTVSPPLYIQLTSILSLYDAYLNYYQHNEKFSSRIPMDLIIVLWRNHN